MHSHRSTSSCRGEASFRARLKLHHKPVDRRRGGRGGRVEGWGFMRRLQAARGAHLHARFRHFHWHPSFSLHSHVSCGKISLALGLVQFLASQSTMRSVHSSSCTLYNSASHIMSFSSPVLVPQAPAVPSGGPAARGDAVWPSEHAEGGSW